MARRNSSALTPSCFELAKLLHDGLHHFAGGFDGRAGVDGQAAGVAVGAQFGEDGVGQALPLADVLEQARTHAAAQQRVQHVTGEALLVRQRIRRHAQAQMHLFERFLVAQGDAGVRGGHALRGRRAAMGGQATRNARLTSLTESLVSQIAGGGDQHVGGRVDGR